MSEENKSTGIFGILEKYIMNPLGKLATTKFVRAIMNTGIAVIPFTIVGSMFLVLNVLPTAIPALQGFYDATIGNFTQLYMLANTATMGVLALYFSVVLGYEFTKVYVDDDGIDMDPVNGALLSLFAFLMAIPQLVWEDGAMVRPTEITDASTIINGWAMGGDGVTRFGTIGIFTAIIMGVLAVQLYRLCIVKNWVIKMPDAVPQGVANSFTALVPTFVIAFTVIILNGALVMFGTDLFQLIQAPFGFVTQITGTYIGVLVIVFLIHALWSVGIHGSTIITSLINPILLANMAENAAGGNHVLAGEFWNSYVIVGGAGATLGLTIFLAFFARSEQLKALGKTTIVPAFFNINEPIIFGVPMIYNPSMFIPFIGAPMVAATIGYFGTKLGFVNNIIAQSPWPMPVGIAAFIGTTDWRAIILAVICVVAAFAVYYPFITKYDKALFVEEQEREAAAEGDDDDFFSF